MIVSRHRSALALTCLVLTAGLGCGRDVLPDPLVVAEDRRQAADPSIASALADADPARRARAALALGRIQDPGSTAALAAAVGDDDPTVRNAALFALGQLGLADGARADPRAVDACSAGLDSDDAEHVALSLEALGKLAPDDLESRVLALGEHADPRVRVAVADALFRRRFVPAWRGQTDDPPPLGEAAHLWLATALGDPSVEVRRAAAHACSRFGEPVAHGALGAALARDPDELVRLWAARALARRDPDAPGGSPVDALASALGDLSPRVRVEVLAGLAAHDGRGRIPLTPARDGSFHVRAAWAAAQGGVGSDGVSTDSALEALLEDDSATVRAAAFGALATLRGADWVDATATWLARDASLDRLAAIAAAPNIGDPVVDVLMSIESDDVAIRVAQLDALAEIGVPAERLDPLIAEALAADDLALRGTGVARIDAGSVESRAQRLRRAYEASPGEDWIELREAVLDALETPADAEGAARDPRTVELLRRAAASDPAGSVRVRAARALEARGLARPAVSVMPAERSRLLPISSALAGSRPRVALETDRGTITLELFAADAPLHVALFLELVDSGFYDGLGWHRVVPNFVIQGGDPRGDGWGGAGTTLRDEINRRPYRRGSLGMPKAGKDTGGGQLFITHIPTPHLDGNYTVFGQVVEGLSVIDLIDRGDRIVRALRVD